MITDIDKLAQQMREAATGVEAALPHGTWDSVRAYHRAQDRFRNVADTESVLAILDDRERLVAALADAKREKAGARGLQIGTAEVLAAKERECEGLKVALADLVSWFPEKPSEPEWRLKAGAFGADDALAAARALVTSGGGDD